MTMPIACGKHAIDYPLLLAQEGVRGREGVFMTSCECGIAYLIKTRSDGAHVSLAGDTGAVMKAYDEEIGEEAVVVDEYGTFYFKRVEGERR